ncbi:CARDB domain-containing protein [Geoglobus acetivorans]|uniref:CARDB domain-containing protein n=1 Tax=Geoglobus acetivorans TaxID=565033 RepID=A0ABZ3H611_GEOAI|nr:hypothetical protein [Geoglobus acetivorans]
MGRIISFSIILILVSILFFQPVSALSDFHIKLVDHVDGYGKYIERTYPFEPGDYLRIYAQVEGVNHYRAYAVDFVYVVYDPEGYPVSGTVISKSGTDYTDRVYAVYELKIPEGWVTGKYKVVVYAFDVLNTTMVKNEYDNFLNELISKGEASIDLSKVSREDVDYVKKELYFTLVDNYDPRVYLFDSGLKAKILPEGMNNSLEFTVLNPNDEKIEFYVRLLIDGTPFSKQKVSLGPGSAERVEFTIPQLEIGDHTLEVVPDWDNTAELKTLPVFIPPYLFDRPVMVAKDGKGLIVLSSNNYVLGSGGVSGLDGKEPSFDMGAAYVMNRDNAAKMLSNILAYIWHNWENNGKNEMRIGLYYRSDSRAENVLPLLLDYIKKLNGAPVVYVGVLEDYELDKADIVFYVSDRPDLAPLAGYVENGGNVVLDITDYYWDGGEIVRDYGFSGDEFLFGSFYDLTSVNKTVSIKLKTELKLPPELKYSNLSVSDFLVAVGENVTISFDVKNEGGAGKAPVQVYVNNEPVYDEILDFYPAEQKHIVIGYTPQSEGSYRVTLDRSDLSKVFFAKNLTAQQNATATPPPEKEKPERENAGLLVAMAGLLAVLIIFRIYLRR